jgi:hypothetical protein
MCSALRHPGWVIREEFPANQRDMVTLLLGTLAGRASSVVAYWVAAAVRLLSRWDELDAWRSSLPHSRQAALNNPRETWAAYLEHRRELGDPEAKGRPAVARRHRQYPSLLEQYEALAEQLEMAEERAEVPGSARHSNAADSCVRGYHGRSSRPRCRTVSARCSR